MRLAAYSLCLFVVMPAAGGFAFSAEGHGAKSPAAGETPAEKLRKALDQVRDLEINDHPLDAAVNQLREQTGINFVIDRATLAPFPGFPGGMMGTGPYAHLRIGGQFHDMPLRTALTKMLRNHDLTHVLVGDTVFITTSGKAAALQLGQVVSVNIEAKPLSEVLKRLSRDTGANVVLDAAKEGSTALTLRLDEVPLETAVELLADEAGLKAVRMNNVLYVTTEARAEKLQKSRPAAAKSPAAGWRVWPDGNGGFRLTPPAGAGIVGGGIGGLRGGVTVFGGGGFAGMGGAVKPVPLTPPLPRATRPAPDKPTQDKPTVNPGNKNKPAPKDSPVAPAIRPNTRTPLSRRKSPNSWQAGG